MRINFLKGFILFVCLRASFTLTAQEVPNTQLFLFQYALQDESLSLSDPTWFSSFNPDGYNNQPHYDQGWWFCSVRMVDSTQNDIYAGNTSQNVLRQITATRDSEYSPTPIGNNSISLVRVEQDGSQRLWAYHYGPDGKREVRFPEVNNVGYHKWINDSTAIIFAVSDPVSLQLVKEEQNSPRFVTSRIGRCLQLAADGAIYFTQRMSEDNPWFLKTWTPGSNRPVLVNSCPPNAEDFVLLDQNHMLISAEQKLYLLTLDNLDNGWKEVADFSKYGWPKITRLAINDKNELMLVVNYSE